MVALWTRATHSTGSILMSGAICFGLPHSRRCCATRCNESLNYGLGAGPSSWGLLRSTTRAPPPAD
jgi:hypothetical protein